MKVSAEQIDRLYQFTRQHYVEYYDLQTEFVDHLANAIEAQWSENPKLSFEEALQAEFKKFGVFGFMDVVEQRQVAMNKKYNKIVWQHFKSFFKIPQIIGTLAVIGILFVFLKNNTYTEEIVTFLIFILLLVLWFGIFYRSQQRKKTEKKQGRKWLFYEIIFGYSYLAGMGYLPMQFLIHFNNKSSIIMLFIMSCVIVFMALLDYIILILIPSKAETYLKETYPEYS